MFVIWFAISIFGEATLRHEFHCFIIDDLDAAADSFFDQAERLSAFTGLFSTNPNNRFILVMGMAGAGKSSFISKCSGKPIAVGYGLYSCMFSAKCSYIKCFKTTCAYYCAPLESVINTVPSNTHIRHRLCRSRQVSV